ncbi:hypothetical protein MNBD_PLANCTO02-1649, partial [hydrothermal vent metagenome]
MTYDEITQWDDDQALQDYLDRELSVAEVLLLEKRLCLEADLADRLIELACDDSVLAEWGAPEIFGKWNFPLQRFRFAFPSFKSFSLRKLSGTTILLMVMTLFWSSLIFLGTRYYFSHQNVQQTAIVKKNTPLPKNRQQTITEGTVELILPTGVKVHITAPATFQVTGENGIVLSRGILLAEVTTEKGKGFTVKTPRGNIVDLGTIFGVEVDASGTSSVQVFKGNVELFSSTGVKTPLAAGNTMRAEVGKEGWQPSEKLSKEFYTVLEKHSSSIISLNEPRGWLGGPDGLTEVLYVMYSKRPLKERFAASNKTQKRNWEQCTNHFAIVHFDKTHQTWIFHSNEFSVEFTPVATDLIFARTDFEKSPQDTEGKRVVTFYQEKYGTIHGIEYGYQASDLQIRPDWSIDPTGRGARNFADYSL